MIQIEQTDMYRRYELEKEFNRKVRNLSVHLITAFYINPTGRELVIASHTLNCADNSEFVYRWVKRRACCASCIKVLSFKKLQREFVADLLTFCDHVGEVV